MTERLFIYLRYCLFGLVFIFLSSEMLTAETNDTLYLEGQVGVALTKDYKVNSATPISTANLFNGKMPEGVKIYREVCERTPCPDLPDYQISGIPKKAGTYKFTIILNTFGTSKSGDRILQHFVIIIKP